MKRRNAGNSKNAALRLGLLAAALLAGAAATGQGAASDAGPSGFAIAASDGAWRLRFRGLIQFDGRVFDDDVTPDSANTWL
jgi:hypothetical protein